MMTRFTSFMKLRVRSAVAMAGGGASSSTPPLLLRLPSPSLIQYFSGGGELSLAASPPQSRGGRRRERADFEVVVAWWGGAGRRNRTSATTCRGLRRRHGARFIYPIRLGDRRRRAHGSSANVARPSDARGLVGRRYPAAFGRSLDFKE